MINGIEDAVSSVNRGSRAANQVVWLRRVMAGGTSSSGVETLAAPRKNWYVSRPPRIIAL